MVQLVNLHILLVSSKFIDSQRAIPARAIQYQGVVFMQLLNLFKIFYFFAYYVSGS